MMTGRTRAHVRLLVILATLALITASPMTLGASPGAAAQAADAPVDPAHSVGATAESVMVQDEKPEGPSGPTEPAETKAETVETPLSDALVVYESGYAVGTRTIQAELQPGPNRLIVGGLPDTVDESRV